MRAVDLIRAVRDSAPLAEDDLRAFIQGVSAGHIPDYQASAFLMAVYHKGLTDRLTRTLTLAMRDSGVCIDLNDVPGKKVDKHSTGGVGDKLSLPLAPWVAACGVAVPMVSGRGLGHTGGTLDKLESIAGFNVNLGVEVFRRQVRELGVCMIGQTKDLAPADRKLYALRDVTATVESIPLITASILSKKLAEGIDALVLDVKVGRGAFMKDLASARMLAASLVRVGEAAGVAVRVLLTRMDAPLGCSIGNALEVLESVAILRNEGPADTTELTRALAQEMLLLGGVAEDADSAQAMLDHALKSGAALDKFRALIVAQGGDAGIVDHPERLPQASQQTTLTAARGGFVTGLDPYVLGQAAMRLGAGRSQATDKIDPAVGLWLQAHVGSHVAAGDPLVVVHHNAPLDTAWLDEVRGAIALGDTQPEPQPLVLARLGD